MKTPYLLILAVFTVCVSASSNAQQYRLQQPPHPPVDVFSPIPVQSYSILDISGTVSSEVYSVSLADDNTAFFSYPSADGSTMLVSKWTNGLVSPFQTIGPLTQTSDFTYTDTQGTFWEVHRTDEYDTGLLTKSGAIYGYLRVNYEYSGQANSDFYGMGFVSSNSSISLLGADLPDQIPQPPTYHFPSHRGFHIATATDSGYAGQASPFQLNNIGYNFLGVVSQQGAKKYFSASPPTVPSGWLKSYFQPTRMNDNGWVIGVTSPPAAADTTYAVWNGTSLSPLPNGYPSDINNANQVVGQIGFYDNDGNETMPTDGYLWKNGVVKKFQDILKAPSVVRWRGQLRRADPLFISTPNPSDQTVTIIFFAECQEAPNSTNWPVQSFVLKLDSNDVPIRLARLDLPAGLSWWDLRGINSNEIVTALGLPDASFSTTHALLLVPTEITFYKPQTSSTTEWQSTEFVQPWEELYRFDGTELEPLKFKVKFAGLPVTASSLDQISLNIATYDSQDRQTPSYKPYRLTGNQISPDAKEVWCSISAGSLVSTYLPTEPLDPAVTEFTSSDWCDGVTASSYKDSDIFDTGIGAKLANAHKRTVARGNGNKTDLRVSDSNFGTIPPLSAKANRSFIIEGGASVIDVSGSRALFRSQVDWLYLSTHGAHSLISDYPSGILETITPNEGTPPARQYIRPEDVHWSIDLNLVIIAGCSVLDIGDHNNHYTGSDHNDSPGKRWEQTGPEILLGYATAAPADTPNGNGIIASWLVYQTTISPISAWALAALDNNITDVCAIKKNDYFGYFSYIKVPAPWKSRKNGKLQEVHVLPVWRTVPKSDW